MKEHTAIQVANFFIGRSLETNTPVTNLSLQKLVFFSHAASLRQYGISLVSDACTAWPYGPVFVPLYDALKRYGNKPVTAKIEVAFINAAGLAEKAVPEVAGDDDAEQFLSSAWDALGGFSAARLVAVSHKRGGAWFETVKGFVDNPDDMDSVFRLLPRNVTIFTQTIRRCGR